MRPAHARTADVAAVDRTLPELAVERILRYRFVRETHGRNRSPEIDYFNRMAGAPLGSSWCLGLPVAGYQEAARILGRRSPLMKTGSVSQQLRYATLVGSGLRVIPIAGVVGVSGLKIPRGAILCARRGGGSAREIGRLWLGHAATNLEQRGARVRTIEGNTSSGARGSQRDGDGVYPRDRPLTWFLAAIVVPD